MEPLAIIKDFRTDQRGVVMKSVYDEIRRTIFQDVTSFGTTGDVDETVKSIGRSYDELGRVTAVTSYAGNNGSGTIRNEVKQTYYDHGKLLATFQSHEGNAVTTEEATGSGGSLTASPRVAVGYITSADTNGVYNNGLRKVVEGGPGNVGSQFVYSSPVSDALNRPNLLVAAVNSTVNSIYYKYNGLNRLVSVNHAIGHVELRRFDLNSGGANVYNGFDRFGRTVDHAWLDTSGMADTNLDRFKYTYDSAGSRLSRDVIASSNDTHDQKFTYDNLHRLQTVDQGTN